MRNSPLASPRLAALGRRASGEAHLITQLCVGEIALDLLQREVRRNGRDVRLQRREFALLEQLLRHAAKIVTRPMFLETVWRYGLDPQTNIVESHVSRMRTKSNEGFDQNAVETLRGIGYRMRAGG